MKQKSKVPDKTKEQILEQLYLDAYDLQALIPKIPYATALKYIKEIRVEMQAKNIFLPEGRTNLALTKLVRKKFGF